MKHAQVVTWREMRQDNWYDVADFFVFEIFRHRATMLVRVESDAAEQKKKMKGREGEKEEKQTQRPKDFDRFGSCYRTETPQTKTGKKESSVLLTALMPPRVERSKASCVGF